MNSIDRLREVFGAVCDLETDQQRQQYLDNHCGDDSSLRERVQALIAADGDAGSFLRNGESIDATIIPSPTNTRLIGTQIGPYKIREQLAEGGMGVVYVAEQTEPVRRKVALKVIRPGMVTRDVVARFEAERQALAMMDHPNIARVFGGGATENGQPYFVMELVQGLPVTDYCDERRLSTRKRLELFVKVCRAVQHAHQKGIIHRDLKPSNVLVAQIDGEAVPKVIDFGVAKAISHKLTDKTLYTQFSQMIGTPLYMSPEQAEMGIVDIDTRSDVYSLGALLYHLLTGTTPFDCETLKQVGFDELRRIIREVEPRRPSVAITTLQAHALSTAADRRHSDPRKLSSSLKGELDWLVMKALEKDRNRRYESPSAMAADIERYLNDEPVKACPPSAGYRFKKFCQRHRGRLLTASFLAVLLLVSGAVAVRGKLENTRVQRQVSQEVEQSVTAARTAIETGDLAAARQRIGEASGRLVTAGQGLTELTATVEQLVAEVDARYEQRQRFEQFQEMARTAMDDMSYDKNLGGDKLAAEAVELYRVTSDDRWLTQLQASFLSEQEQEIVRQTAYETLLVLADFGVRWSRSEESAVAGLKHLQLAEMIHSPTRAFYWVRSECQTVLQNKNEAKHDLELFESTAATTAFDYYLPGKTAGWRNDREEAIRSFEAALRIQPDHFNSLFFLATGLTAEGRKTEAAQLYRACHAIRPNHVPTLRNRASLLTETGESEEALELLSKAIELKPASAIAYAIRGDCYSSMHQNEKALLDLDEALRLATLHLSADTSTTMNIYGHRAKIFNKMKLYDKALDDLNAAVKLGAKIPDKDSQVIVFHAFTNRALGLSNMGQHVKALEDSDQALRMAASPKLAVNANHLARAHEVRGRILIDTQRNDEALTELDKALALASESNHILLNDIWLCRAYAFEALGRSAETVRELNRVIEHGTDEGKDWATNQLAWVLATCPDLAVRDVPRALELANQAVERDPDNGSHWNTRGVAQYRAGDLTAAVTSLNKSLQLGDAAQAENLLFLAMAHWQLGHPDEARQSYDMAARWMTDKKSTGEELLRFQAEAEVTLGIDPETPILETRNGPSVEAIISTEKASRGDSPTSSNDP